MLYTLALRVMYPDDKHVVVIHIVQYSIINFLVFRLLVIYFVFS